MSVSRQRFMGSVGIGYGIAIGIVLAVWAGVMLAPAWSLLDGQQDRLVCVLADERLHSWEFKLAQPSAEVWQCHPMRQGDQ